MNRGALTGLLFLSLLLGCGKGPPESLPNTAGPYLGATGPNVLAVNGRPIRNRDTTELQRHTRLGNHPAPAISTSAESSDPTAC